MAEAAGLAIGVAGLVGLYGSVIEAFGQIGTAKAFSRDLEVLSTRYDIRRTRLLQWGDGVGLLSQNCEEQDLRFNQANLHPLLERALNCILTLLTDVGSLRDKYGLEQIDLRQSPSPTDSDAMDVLSKSRLDTFNRSISHFRRSIDGRQKRTSLLKKTAWAIHGGDSFRLLLNDLDGLIGDLYALMPIAPGFHRLMIKEDIDRLPEDLGLLKLVEEACARDSDSQEIDKKNNWLEAVSVKVEASERASLHQQNVSHWLADVAVASSVKNDLGDIFTPPSLNIGRLFGQDPNTNAMKPPEYSEYNEYKYAGVNYSEIKKRRREIHNAVERRRRDNISHTIQEIWHLTPKERVNKILVEDQCKKYFRLGEKEGDSDTRLPLTTHSSAAEALSALAPFLDIDMEKSPNKGQILTAAVRWIAELMLILDRKYKEEEELRSMIKEMGKNPPWMRYEEDQEIKEHLVQCHEVLQSLAESYNPISVERIVKEKKKPTES